MGYLAARLAAGGSAVLLLLIAPSAIPADTVTAPATTSDSEAAFVTTYCVACHNDRAKTGGLTLQSRNFARMADDADIWEKVVGKLDAGMMPPAGVPRPGKAETNAFVTGVETQLDHAAMAHPNPGAPALHRLNRTEYANAIRDLLALDIDASTMLPADDSADGFDNIADVLGVSPSLIESYVAAAMKLSRTAVGDRSMVATRTTYRAEPGLAQDKHIEGLPLGSRGGMLVRHTFPLDAEYEFDITAPTSGFALGPGGPRERTADVDVTLNGQPVTAANTAKFTIPVKAGPQVIGVSLVDRQRPAGVDDIYSTYAVGGGVQSVVIIGPNKPTGVGDTPSRRRLFVCHPTAVAQEEPCARKIFAKVASRAFRQPIGEHDPLTQPLMAA
jgi:mono/diheme cytochrome c family protein